MELDMERPKRKRNQPNYAELSDSCDDSPVDTDVPPTKKSKGDMTTSNDSDIGGNEVPAVVDEKPKKKKSVAQNNKRSSKKGEKQDKKKKSKPPPQTKLERALSQPIHFIDRHRCDVGDTPQEKLTICGSQGKDYTVTIYKRSKCTCLDFVYRRHPCKHMIYTLVRVFKVAENSDLLEQTIFSPDELREIFGHAPPAHTATAIDGENGDPNRKPIEGDCPICFMELEPQSNKIVYCKAHCGNNIHHGCMQTWLKSQQKTYHKRTCPYCRQNWVD